MAKELTGYRDKNGEPIKEGDIVMTRQGTKFVVLSDGGVWYLIQSNKGSHEDLQGDWFDFEGYMGFNLEIIGSIYDNHSLKD